MAGDAANTASQIGTVSTAWAVFSVVGGSIIGAFASALVSFIIQRRNIKAAKAQRDDDRAEVRKALGYSLLFKMIKLSSSLQNLSNAIESAIQDSTKQGFHGQLWQVVTPIVPAADEIHFSPEEMALILSLDDGLFNEIAAMDDLHNSTCAIIQIYGGKREKVLERFGAQMTGNHGVTALTQEQVNWLAPRALELNGLVAAARERATSDGKTAWDTLERLRDLLEKKLGIKHRLERKSPRHEAATTAS